MKRLADFFFESSDTRLSAIYVIDAVLTTEKKKLKQHYLADLFGDHLRSILETFRDATEKERVQVGKVIARWKKHAIFSQSKLDTFGRDAMTLTSLSLKKPKESKGLKVSFDIDNQERSNYPSKDDSRGRSDYSNKDESRGRDLDTSSLMASLNRAKQSSADVVDLGKRANEDRHDDQIKRSRIDQRPPPPPEEPTPPPPPSAPPAPPDETTVKATFRGMPKFNQPAIQPKVSAWGAFATTTSSTTEPEKPKSGWGKFS